MNTKTVLRMLSATLAAVVLAGSGTSATPAAPGAATTTTATAPAVAPAAARNDADVAFVQGMIRHHAQAIQMSQSVRQATQRNCWPQDGGDRRRSRVDFSKQDGTGGAGAP